MLDHQLHALSKAWVVTMAAVSLLIVVLAVCQIWDFETYRRAVNEVLTRSDF